MSHDKQFIELSMIMIYLDLTVININEIFSQRLKIQEKRKRKKMLKKLMF